MHIRCGVGRLAALLIAFAASEGVALVAGPPSAADRPGYTVQFTSVARRPIPSARQTLRQMWEMQRALPRPDSVWAAPEEETHEKRGGPTTSLRVPEAPATANPVIALNFPGLDLTVDPATPPDTMGVAGPNHFIELINGRAAFFYKDGTPIADISLEAFFNVPGIPTNRTFDPHIMYDFGSSRFIACAAQGTASPNSYLMIAVSATSDPTGIWYKWAIDADIDNGSTQTQSWMDYPLSGYDSTAVYVTGNMFPNTGFNVHPKIWIIPKAQLLSGNTSITWSENTTLTGANIAPCESFGAPSAEYLVTPFFDPSTETYTQLRVYGITNPTSSPTLTLLSTISLAMLGDPPDSPQLGSAALINSGDARFINAVWRNNSLWTAHAINIGGRAGARWYQISTSATPAIVQSGDIADANRSYFFPSVAVNAAGEVLFGFSGSSPTQFVGGYCAGRQAGDPAGATSAPLQIKSGEDYYAEDVGSGRIRWGDYSATSVDPSDDISFWSIQEYAKTPGSTWGTQWARINLTASPLPPNSSPTPTPTPGTSNVVTNTADTGAGSLRNAINYANAHTGTTITFNIPNSNPNFAGGVFTVKPVSSLPPITANGTVIDGATQTAFTGDTNPSGPEIILSGLNSGLFGDGLRINAANCAIKQLVVNNFTSAGIKISGATAFGNNINGCYIGTNATGTGAAGNGEGIDVRAGAHDNLIDGTSPSGRNVISGNLDADVEIEGAGTNNNVVRGNHIGVNFGGTALVSNNTRGITVFGGAQGNTIGGPSAAHRNVVSGHGAGVVLFGVNTNSNVIQGNYIGTNAAGTAALGNLLKGIQIRNGASSNVVGGTLAGAGNLISGNATDTLDSSATGGIDIASPATSGNIIQGNLIGTDVTGNAAIGNKVAGIQIRGGPINNIIGGTSAAARNLISGNTGTGIKIIGAGTNGNSVQGNVIGLANNSSLLSNSSTGIVIDQEASSNTIGGATNGARNVVSGNSQGGISIGVNCINNLVQGNYIGLDPTGLTARANSGNGIALGSAQATQILNNIISSNSSHGISMIGATNNVVQGNFIGLAVDGSTSRGNSGHGVALTFSSGTNTIGGTTAAARNLIASSGGHGVYISDAASNNNIIQGNFIGTDISGSLARGCSYGVGIHSGAWFNQVLDNVVSNSTNDGVTLDGSANFNVVQGNIIGTDLTGSMAMGNRGNGVTIAIANGNVIGGNLAELGNRIAFSRLAGVAVISGVQNSIQHNTIYGNGALGIDLGTSGVTPNDLGDADGGSNNLQNFPAITSATVSASGTTVTGSINSGANAPFTIEFFLTPACNAPAPSDCGEGEIFLGSTMVTTNGSGDAPFNLVLPMRVPAGQSISATATAANGDTSEFSHCATVAIVDTDGDGLPDDYETANGLNPNNSNDGAADKDGDGSSNLTEFYAHTNPSSAASAFRITNLTKIGSEAHLTFSSLTGITYRIEYNSDLTNTAGWLLLADNIPGTGGLLDLVDGDAFLFPRRFYRLEPALHFPPSNDRFINAQTLTGTTGSAVGSNVAATREAGEPSHAAKPGGASVWFKWVAPLTANATFITAGSEFDTLLGVYTGNSVNALGPVAGNDDVSGSDSSSKVTFGVTAGVTYYIAVDGDDLGQGRLKLSWSMSIPPPNDNFANGQLVTGDSGTVSADTTNATKEPGEPNHNGNTGGHSIWYSWTASTSGSVTFKTTGSTFDTIMAVYTGSAVNALSFVASDDDSGGNNTSLITFNAVAGTTYKVAVDGFSGASGNVTFSWQRP